MLIYLIVFIYYLFICVGIFYFLKVKSYCILQNKSRIRKFNDYLRRKKVLSEFVEKINLVSYKIGSIFTNKKYFKVNKETIELLKILEFENNVFITPESFRGYKVILLFLLIIAGSFIGNNVLNSILFSVVGGVVGYFIPDLLLKNFNHTRQKEIEKDLPDIIDLLIVATLSGQNIYNAIKIVVLKYKGRICLELSNFIKDVDMGAGKLKAYRNLIDRSNSYEFKNFIFLLIQAERYGSSINEILKRKSDYIKFEAYQSLERKIRRTAVLILFPLVFLILPSFIILVGGPLIYSIGGNFLKF